MTLSQLLQRAKEIGWSLTSSDVPLKCNEKDFDIDFEIISKNASVSHIEVKPSLVLSWKDIAAIDKIIVDCNNEFAVDYSREISREAFYSEVLKRFNAELEKK